MKVTIETIESKEFKVKPRGYDQVEVDEFLDEICDEMAVQLDQIQSLQQQLMTAQAQRPAATEAPVSRPAVNFAKPVAPAQDHSDSFREILEMAQKVKDETIASAQKQADDILAEAQLKADEKLHNLQSERDELQKQLVDLKAAAADYRARFESLLQAQQEALEKASNLF